MQSPRNAFGWMVILTASGVLPSVVNAQQPSSPPTARAAKPNQSCESMMASVLKMVDSIRVATGKQEVGLGAYDLPVGIDPIAFAQCALTADPARNPGAATPAKPTDSLPSKPIP